MFIGEHPDLLDLWVFNEEKIYVVGKDGIPQYYDGEEWYPVRTENTNPLMGIWASAQDNIYAVGVGGVVLKYDGKNWNQMETGSYDSLNSAFGLDADHVFLFGVGGRMLYWDGENGTTANRTPFMISLACGARISITSTPSAEKAFTAIMTVRNLSGARN